MSNWIPTHGIPQGKSYAALEKRVRELEAERDELKRVCKEQGLSIERMHKEGESLDEGKWYPKNLQYNPACSICRDLAGKARAGVEDWELCIVHLQSEYDRMNERITPLEDALRNLVAECDLVYPYTSMALEQARVALEVKP
jgi:hypothetical protein